jgi:hypothetical protein
MPLLGYAKVRLRPTTGSVALRATCWHRDIQTLYRMTDRFQKKHIPFCHTAIQQVLRTRRLGNCVP